MKSLNLSIAKDIVIHRYSEDEMIPLVLFTGNLSVSKAQALYKISLMMMEAEFSSVKEIKDATSQSRDLVHMTGLHDFSKFGIDIRPFFSRIINCPDVIELNPKLKDYIYWVKDNSNGFFIYKLNPISRYSSKSRREFRYKPDEKKITNKLFKENSRIKKLKVVDTKIVIPEFYPFYTEEPTKEYELLEWAHHLVPKTLPDYWRQDVCQELIMSLLSGDITKENAESKVQKYIKKTFKDYPTLYGPLSLDAPLGHDGDDGFTLGDVIEDSHVHI